MIEKSYTRSAMELIGSAPAITSDLVVTATAAAAAGVTLTLPAPAAGKFHYITSICIQKVYSAVALLGAAPVVVTSTNLGGLAWTFGHAALGLGQEQIRDHQFPSPVKSAVAATASTIVCPAQSETMWRVSVHYYTAT